MGKLKFLVGKDMKLELKERKRNALMKREEAMISIEHGGKATPDRRQVLADAAKLLNARPETTIIERITTPGGRASSDARVLAYSRKEDIPAWRLQKMEQRMTKKKPEEKPAEASSAGGEKAGEEAGQETPEKVDSGEKPTGGPDQEEPQEDKTKVRSEEKSGERPKAEEKPAEGEKGGDKEKSE
jgi:ribosomal protein S24E